MGRLRQLIHEIHRRSLWQVLGIYAVASWAVLQVVDTLGGALNLPDWFPSFALALLIIGLPVVLATAFVQEGASGSPPPSDGSSAPTVPPASGFLTWRNAIGGGVLAFALWGVVAAGWVLFGAASAPPSREGESPEVPVIAVLPFENMSGDPEDIYFTNGMREEVRTSLSKVGGLRVITPPVIGEGEDRSGSLRQLAEGLSLKYVQASVRRATDQVRISVQLIDADSDEQLWAEVYTHELSPAAVFEIQSDVARRIANALSAELTPEEAVEVAERPTDSQEAYDLLLRGTQSGGFTESNLRAAALAYQGAVDIDPSFTRAWAFLAGAHINLYWFRHDYSEDRLALARDALARAEQLDPNDLDVLETQGLYHYQGELNYERALSVYRGVLEEDPSRGYVWAMIGYVQRRMGLLDETEESLRRAEDLDPLNPTFPYQRGETAILRGRHNEAQQHLRRALALSPEWLRPFGYLALVPVLRDGDLDAGRAVLAEAVRAGAFAEDDVFGPYAWLVIDRLSRDFESAERRIRDEGWDPVESQFFYWPAAFLLAEYHRFDGRHDQAQQSYRAAEVELVEQLRQRPEDARLHSTLGRVYAGLGSETQALQYGRSGVSLMPVESEAYRGTFQLEDLAAIHATLGNQDEAIDLLERVADLPTYLSRQLLRLDPTWDALREDPRFDAVVGLYP